MRIEGDYHRDGYATIRGLVPPEVASNLFKQLQIDLANSGKTFENFAKLHDLSRHQTVDISGHFYRPLTTFLWGLTPIIGERSFSARSSSARSWISIKTSMP